MNNPAHGILDPHTEILIVDDSPDYSSVLRRFLANRMGYTAITVMPSLAAAHQLIRENPERFSVFFLDYHFPNGETGGDLLESLRSEGLYRDQVAFFITAEPAVEKAIEANHMGVAGVVIKPFNSQNLQTLITRVDRALQMDRDGDDQESV